jgi:hypothetical protein
MLDAAQFEAPFDVTPLRCRGGEAVADYLPACSFRVIFRINAAVKDSRPVQQVHHRWARLRKTSPYGNNSLWLRRRLRGISVRIRASPR